MLIGWNGSDHDRDINYSNSINGLLDETENDHAHEWALVCSGFGWVSVHAAGTSGSYILLLSFYLVVKYICFGAVLSRSERVIYLQK